MVGVQIRMCGGSGLGVLVRVVSKGVGGVCLGMGVCVGEFK